jgi:hypothetical protein
MGDFEVQWGDENASIASTLSEAILYPAKDCNSLYLPWPFYADIHGYIQWLGQYDPVLSRISIPASFRDFLQ